MSTLLQDTFTDTNGTALSSHTMEVGSGWTLGGTAAITIEGNSASIADGGWGQALTVSPAADYSFSIDHLIPVDAGAYDYLVLLRSNADVTNCVYAAITKTGGGTPQLVIKQNVSGTPTTLAGPTDIANTYGTGRTITGTVSGSSLLLNLSGDNVSLSASFNSGLTDTGIGFGADTTGGKGECSFNNFVVTSPVAAVPTISTGGTVTNGGTALIFAFNPQGAACTADASKFALNLQATLGTSVSAAVVATGTTNPQPGTLTLAAALPPGVTIGFVAAADAITNINGNSTAGTFTTVNANTTPEDITDAVTFTATGEHAFNATFDDTGTIVADYLSIAEPVFTANNEVLGGGYVEEGDLIAMSVRIGDTVLAVTDDWAFSYSPSTARPFHAAVRPSVFASAGPSSMFAAVFDTVA